MIKSIFAATALSATLLVAPELAEARPYDRDGGYRGDYSEPRHQHREWRECGRGYEFHRGRCYWIGPYWRDDWRHGRRHGHRHGW